MEISRKRVRKEFCPLTLSVSLTCESEANSPMMQTFDAYSEEFVPNRILSPLVLRPIVFANTNDGSWNKPSVNAMLSNLKWYISGVDITTLPEWEGEYSVEADGHLRGSITIYKNILPGQSHNIHFEADFADVRLGVIHHIKTEAVVLSTIDKSKDEYRLSINKDNIQYNPFLDKLHLYNYNVAHGNVEASEELEASFRDENCYDSSIGIDLFKGADSMPKDRYTIKLFRKLSNHEFEEILPIENEVISISTSEVRIDLRLVNKCDYLLKAYVDGEEVDMSQFSITRVFQRFSCNPINEASISLKQQIRLDTVHVELEGKLVEHPESILKIQWYTDTANKTGVYHNEGEKTSFLLSKTGIGDTFADDWMETYVEVEQKGCMSIACDSDGESFGDANGELYIFN